MEMPRYRVTFDVGDLLERMPDDVCRRVIARRLAELEDELTAALLTGLSTPNVRQVYPETRPERMLGCVRTDLA